MLTAHVQYAADIGFDSQRNSSFALICNICTGRAPYDRHQIPGSELVNFSEMPVLPRAAI